MADKTSSNSRPWINDLEIQNAQIKWNWSHFAGAKAAFNDEGDHNFLIILSEQEAKELEDIGWSIRTQEGQEEGDPPQYLLKAKISFRYEDPRIFFLKGTRKFRAKEKDLSDIRRDTCEQLDVVLSPSFWTVGDRTGVTAYVKEMYVKIRESRFDAMYADYEEV